MRISDWSSDVCSSDVPFGNRGIKACSQLPHAYRSVPRPSSPVHAKAFTKCPYLTLESPNHQRQRRAMLNKSRSEECRVGKRGSGRVDPGGSRISNKITKKNNIRTQDNNTYKSN